MQKSPDAFRTISEVADWLDTPAHVLRFWESRFTQIKPIKRAGGRRYYRPADMALLGGIKQLLHDDGMTIRGVQKLLREHGVKYVAQMSPAIDGYEPDTPEIRESEEVPAAPMAIDVPQAPTETKDEPKVVPFARATETAAPPLEMPVESLAGSTEAADVNDPPEAKEAPAEADLAQPNLFDFDAPLNISGDAPVVSDDAPSDNSGSDATDAVEEAPTVQPAPEDKATEIREPLSAISTVLEKADPYHTDHPERLVTETPEPDEPQTVAPQTDEAAAENTEMDAHVPPSINVAPIVVPDLPEDPSDDEAPASGAVYRSKSALGAADPAVLKTILERASALRSRLGHAD
ncbi:MerR family transcriptional regulator [Celeribacter sp.]|uniref:MerR family transcriptional regulator n=1 Tax=Celeribacter sp. TaxID=1890673 RepID=UPI003A959D7A